VNDNVLPYHSLLGAGKLKEVLGTCPNGMSRACSLQREIVYFEGGTAATPRMRPPFAGRRMNSAVPPRAVEKMPRIRVCCWMPATNELHHDRLF
jgi:hypothetical protein